MIDVNKIKVGSKLRIWKLAGETKVAEEPKIIKVLYMGRLLASFIYEDISEDWLPIANFNDYKAEFV